MNSATFNLLTATSEQIGDLSAHQIPVDFADRFALGFTKFLRLIAEPFFAKRHGHRAIVLETVAALPGLVDATIQHHTSLRRMVDAGRSANVPTAYIAKHYCKLPADATLRDVVLTVRADEAHHRDINHGFANELAGMPAGGTIVAPYPPHADTIRQEP